MRTAQEEAQSVTCRTILLDDQPLDRDALGGPHQRVADALHEMLVHENHGGRAIGLEGPWGSGKTTIAGHLAGRLGKRNDFCVFNFNTWAHEGDPLRRNFIEELANALVTKGWFSKNDADVLLSELREKRTRPILSAWAIVFACLLLLVPLGTSLVERDWGYTVSFQGEAWAPEFLVGLSLALAPLVLIGLYVLFRIGRFAVGDPTHDTLFSILTPNGGSETIHPSEPTSIEFGTLFDQLVSSAFRPCKEGFFGRFRKRIRQVTSPQSRHSGFVRRRLLIIVDNLDRVDRRTAQTIWATLQTFLAERRESPWFRDVWFLVPYDVAQVPTKWAGTDDEGFLSKSLAVRFHVPPPIQDGWKDYLFQQLNEALPDHPNGEWHDVYRTFDTCRSGTNEPTFREIKLFVNALGTAHRQWFGDCQSDKTPFPLSHVACFVLNRNAKVAAGSRENLDFPGRLRVGDPKLAPSWLMSPELMRNLAGLWFNRSPGDGMELLLAVPIRQALVTGDQGAIRQLYKTHGRPFFAPLEATLDRLHLSDRPEVVLLTARALLTSGLGDVLPNQEKEVVRRWLDAGCRAVKTWTPLGELVTGALELMRFCGVQDHAEPLFHALGAGLKNYGVGPPEDRKGVAEILRFLEFLDNEHKPVVGTLDLQDVGPFAGSVWLAILSENPNATYWSRFSVAKLTLDMLANALEHSLRGHEPPPDAFLAAVVAMHDSDRQREWNQAVELVAAPLRSGQATGAKHQSALDWRMRWLWVLSQHGSVAARKVISDVLPSRITGLSGPLLTCLAVEYLAVRRGADGTPGRRCTQIVRSAQARAECVAHLLGWEGGGRLVPFVRVCKEYPDPMRNYVRALRGKTGRCATTIRADHMGWISEMGPVERVWNEMASDIGLDDPPLE